MYTGASKSGRTVGRDQTLIPSGSASGFKIISVRSKEKDATISPVDWPKNDQLNSVQSYVQKTWICHSDFWNFHKSIKFWREIYLYFHIMGVCQMW